MARPDDTQAVRCRECCGLLPVDTAGAARDCPRCRKCWRAVFVGLLIPVAFWLIGIPFEGRYAGAHSSLFFTVGPYYDWTLVAPLVGDFAFLSWLVWYTAGLRWRMLIMAIVQFLCCVYVVLGDFLWSAGPL